MSILADNCFLSESVRATHGFAAKFLAENPYISVIALHGELGSGKTCFVQGLAVALGIKQLVTSPTFTVINEYDGKKRLFHMDLYRLNDPDEVLALGFEEYLEAGGIIAIEWPDRAADLLPDNTAHVHLATTDIPGKHKIVIDI